MASASAQSPYSARRAELGHDEKSLRLLNGEVKRHLVLTAVVSLVPDVPFEHGLREFS